MEDFEIIFNDNEPEIKVSIDKTYSMRDFKKNVYENSWWNSPRTIWKR